MNDTWKLEARDLCWAIADEKGDIAYIPRKPYFHEGEPAGSLCSRGRTEEELAANAHLITAAPKLLKALVATVVALEAHIAEVAQQFNMPPSEVCPCMTTTVAQANKVIAEAKGKAT